MKDQYADFVKAIEEDDKRPPDDRWDELVALGIIDEEGRVTGHLHRWDAYLAVEKISLAKDRKKVAVFHCLKPWAGIPGGEPRDVCRDALIDFMRQGKKIITTYWDQRLRLWREGDTIHLTPKGFLRIDRKNIAADNLGTTPEQSPDRNGIGSPHENNP